MRLLVVCGSLPESSLRCVAGDQQRAPAARAGISSAGPIRIDLDVTSRRRARHEDERVVGLTRPPIAAGFSRKRGRIGVRV